MDRRSFLLTSCAAMALSKPGHADDLDELRSFAPAARWQYSGKGYALLQRMLEVVTECPLQQLAEQELFAPIGLTDTALKLTPVIQPNLVAGAPRQLRFPYEIAPSSLYTSANDYARFMAAVLGDEQLLALIMRDPVKLPAPRLSWGLGWGIEERGRSASIWHWGSNPGFRSLAMAGLGALGPQSAPRGARHRPATSLCGR